MHSNGPIKDIFMAPLLKNHEIKGRHQNFIEYLDQLHLSDRGIEGKDVSGYATHSLTHSLTYTLTHSHTHANSNKDIQR